MDQKSSCRSLVQIRGWTYARVGWKVEIDDTFPDEHVFSASHGLISWFADFENYLASDIVPSNLSFHQRKKFMHDVKKFFGMSHIYIGVVSMGLFSVVCRILRCWVFWKHASPRLWVGIIVVFRLPIKSCNVATIGQPFTKILMSSPRHVVVPKRWRCF